MGANVIVRGGGHCPGISALDGMFGRCHFYVKSYNHNVGPWLELFFLRAQTRQLLVWECQEMSLNSERVRLCLWPRPTRASRVVSKRVGLRSHRIRIRCVVRVVTAWFLQIFECLRWNAEGCLRLLGKRWWLSWCRLSNGNSAFCIYGCSCARVKINCSLEENDLRVERAVGTCAVSTWGYL